MRIPPEMQFSDQDIIRAAVKAASKTKFEGIDLKDIYIELLDCTAYSKLYLFRSDIVSRQRVINVILTNGFSVVDSSLRCKMYAPKSL